MRRLPIARRALVLAFRRRRILWAMVLAALVSLAAGETARAKPYIELGSQQAFPDQPYVTVELFAPDASNPGQWVSVGPEGAGGLFEVPYNYFLLDTGANAILAVDAAARSLESYSAYVTEAEFAEMGVAGVTVYDVSAPYRFTFAGSDGIVHELPMASDGVRIQSNPSAQLGGPVDWFGIAGLVGMPAMVNRVTKLDFSAWSDMHDLFDFTPMKVTFSDDLPVGNGHRYSVAVDNRIAFAAADGRPEWEDPDSPLPTYADVPFMTAIAGHHDAGGLPVKRAGSFLLDTGAQFTVLSRSMAFRLGLDANGDGDLNDDAVDSVEVGGVGGSRIVPVMLLDEFRLPTQEGVDLVWKSTDPEDLGLQMIVLDVFSCGDVNGDGIVTSADADVVQAHWGWTVVAGDLPSGDVTGDGLIGQDDLDVIQSQLGQDTFLDGIFGVDLLTAGVTLNWTTWEFEGDPYFQQVYFDFRDMDEGSGTVYLDLTPSYDQEAPMLGDANNDGVVDAADASIVGAHWLQPVSGGFADGDFNSDGIVDDQDAAIMAAHWTQSEPIPGDANGDGKVDAEDASILGSHWLQSVSGGFDDGDFNSDGIVDDQDAAIMAAHWGSGAEGNPAVPEPATLTLLVAGLALLALRRLGRVQQR